MPIEEWSPSPNFSSREGRKILAIVNHITAGSFPGCLSWMQNPASQASAHYLVTKSGRIIQMVKEGDKAWHAGAVNKPNWSLYDGTNPNLYTLGIEHEGQPGDAMPEEQYQATLFLHKELTAKYGIPIDTEHIIGHYRIDSVNRPNCPGPKFPWDKLFKDLKPVTVMYRVILDGKQTMALSSQDAAIAEVRKAVDEGKAQKGIVQRNTDGASVFDYAKTQTPAPTPITPKTPIMGTETITVEQCKQFLSRHNPNAPDIISFYEKHGKVLGIRWGYAVAQMIKETGYLKFGGDVKANQNNFAGIGAVGNGAAGAAFLTPEAGVIAQLQHLFAYASTDALGDYAQIDPRFHLVKRGSCPNWEDLNGHWAVPGNGYGEEIIEIYKKMVAEVVSVAAPTESGAVGLLRKILQLLLDFFKGEK